MIERTIYELVSKEWPTKKMFLEKYFCLVCNASKLCQCFVHVQFIDFCGGNIINKGPFINCVDRIFDPSFSHLRNFTT